MTTENEAKTKWCPFSRTGIYAGDGAVAVNRHCSDDMKDVRDRLLSENTRCLGSGCMAWRWAGTPHLKQWGYIPGEPETVPSLEAQEKTRPEGEGWKITECGFEGAENDWFVRWERSEDKERRGQCGLSALSTIGNFTVGISGGGGGGVGKGSVGGPGKRHE